MNHFFSNKENNKFADFLIFIAGLIVLNLILALIIGDISLNFLIPDWSFHGLKNFLLYLGYSDIALYLGFNSLFICIFFYLYQDKGFYPFVGLFLLILFSAINIIGSPDSNEKKIALYNYLLENNIQSHRICQHNLTSILYANIYRKYNTPNLCSEEIKDFIYQDNMVKEYANFVLSNKNEHPEEYGFARRDRINNGKFNPILENVCESNCRVLGKKNYNDLFSYLKNNLSQDSYLQSWTTFNQSLFNYFKDIKYDYKIEEGKFTDAQQVVTKTGKFWTTLRFYTENKITLEKNVFLTVDLSPSDMGRSISFSQYQGFYFAHTDSLMIPLTQENYTKLSEMIQYYKQRNKSP